MALLEVAREAFTRGLQATAYVSAVVVLAGAVLAVALLRHLRPGVSIEPDETPDDNDDLAPAPAAVSS